FSLWPSAAFLFPAEGFLINEENLSTPPIVTPPRRRSLFFALLAFPRPALTRAHLARAAAAIFARAAADILRRPALRWGEVAAPTPQPTLLTKLTSRRSNASIWRRIDKALSKFRVDKSIGGLDRWKSLCM